jgi:predicted Fe-S protein YdhL (DUF1289 family)
MNTMAQRTQAALACASDLPSPCISLCRMRAGDGLCEGCWRTLDEIVRWSGMNGDEKRAVWIELAQRAEGARA